jgi:hypothetical protein
MLPSDLERMYVRNRAGLMTPFSAFASGRWSYGSPRLERYNAFPSINILGEAAPGRSSGEAMQAMEEIVGRLPQGIGHDWSGVSYQERMAKSQTGLLYAFSMIVIFLCLAALYESWTVPISIMLVLPLGLIGGVLASSWRGLPNDVYFQIGLLTVLGLTTKNAILIVQFALLKVEQGADLIQATLEGAKLRFRPIVMTSLAFGFACFLWHWRLAREPAPRRPSAPACWRDGDSHLSGDLLYSAAVRTRVQGVRAEGAPHCSSCAVSLRDCLTQIQPLRRQGRLDQSPDAAYPARAARLRSTSFRSRLRRRIAAGVTSTSSSASMNSSAISSVITRGGFKTTVLSADAARMLVSFLPRQMFTPRSPSRQCSPMTWPA